MRDRAGYRELSRPGRRAAAENWSVLRNLAQMHLLLGGGAVQWEELVGGLFLGFSFLFRKASMVSIDLSQCAAESSGVTQIIQRIGKAE